MRSSFLGTQSPATRFLAEGMFMSQFVMWRLCYFLVKRWNRGPSKLKYIQHLTIQLIFFFHAGQRLARAPARFQSSYVGHLARRVRDADEATEVAHLKELYHRNDPEAVIRLFESQPSLHSNPSAVAEYVKALVKVGRLDDSELVKTLQRGGPCI